MVSPTVIWATRTKGYKEMLEVLVGGLVLTTVQARTVDTPVGRTTEATGAATCSVAYIPKR